MRQAQFFKPSGKPEIDRKRRMAQMLIEQGKQPQGTEVVSGYAVKQSPIAGLARALSTGLGGMQEAKAAEMEQQKADAARQAMADAITGYNRSQQGGQTQLQSGENINWSKSNPEEANKILASILMQNEDTQPYGANIAMQGIEDQQRLAQAQQLEAIRNQITPYQQQSLALEREKMARALQPGQPATPIAAPVPQQLPMQGPPAPPQALIQQPIANGLPQNPGVPETAPDPFIGVKGRSRDALINNVRQTAIKRMNDKDTTAQLAAARTLKDRMGRFQDLSQIQDTGGALINTPIIGSAMKTFDPELSEMQSIQSELAPKMRVPGSGSSSDIDVQMFKQATIGPEKPKQTNQNIAKAFITAQENLIDRDQFLRDYLDYHGHVQGAEQAWNQYLNANPIFSPNTDPANPALNPDRKTYREYFGATIPNTPQETKADKVRAHMAAKGATPEQIEAFIAEQGIQ